MKRFGEKLKALRLSRGMTLQDLALELGYKAHGYISEIETGKKLPSVDCILNVSNIFDVSIDLLMKDDLNLRPSDLKKKIK